MSQACLISKRTVLHMCYTPVSPASAGIRCLQLEMRRRCGMVSRNVASTKFSDTVKGVTKNAEEAQDAQVLEGWNQDEDARQDGTPDERIGPAGHVKDYFSTNENRSEHSNMTYGHRSAGICVQDLHSAHGTR